MLGGPGVRVRVLTENPIVLVARSAVQGALRVLLPSKLARRVASQCRVQSRLLSVI